MMTVMDQLVAGHPDALAGMSILVATHATTATARLIRAVTALGADVTQIPVVYGGRPYIEEGISTVLDIENAVRKLPKFDVILEDGMRISRHVHEHMVGNCRDGLYVIEQTTSGRRSFEKRKHLPYPVISLADSTKTRA